MTGLWIAVAVMSIITVLMMLYPFARRKTGEARSRADFDITVYKDQLAEITRDLERGLLDEQQAALATTEIERRMLQAAGDDGAPATAGNIETTGKGNPLVAALMIVMLVVVPVGSIGLYLLLGSPEMDDQPLALREQQLHDASQGRQRVVEMVARLEQQMQATPDDPNGWALLGRSYLAMGRMDDAVGALEKLVDLTGRDPQALVMLGEAMVERDQGVVSELTRQVFAEAKPGDPGEPRTYFYISLALQQRGNIAGAVNELADLLRNSPENAEWVPEIIERIEQVRVEGDIPMPEITMLPPVVESAPPGPDAQQVEAARQMSDEDQQAMIRSMVERLAERLKNEPDDLEGWQRLENAYRVLGETKLADEARANIRRLSGQ